MIAKPDDKVVSWLDSFAALNHLNVAFFLELCGAKDGEDTHMGKFTMLHSGMISKLLKFMLLFFPCM